MKTKSIWLENVELLNCPSLNEDLEVDVLIVGGGLTGISLAYHLKETNLTIALLEQNKIGHGVTSKTTGKLTYFQDVYPTIVKSRGLNTAKTYLQSQKDAIKIVKNIIETHQIECDFVMNRSYLYACHDRAKWQKARSIFEKMNCSFHSYRNENIEGGYVEDTYVFHPLKYLVDVAKVCIQNGIKIYENTRVYSIKKAESGYLCQVNNHRIFSKKVVIASHYPFFLIPFFMPIKSYLEKSYVMAYLTNDAQKYNSLSLDEPTISTRFHQDYAIYLSNTHFTYTNMKDRLHFKDLLSQDDHPSYLWSNKDLMTYDGLPFIGSLNQSKTLLIATGYNTWGMTNSSLAGKILADILLNRQNMYQSLFNPRRYLTLTHAPQIMSILYGNTKAYISSKKNMPRTIRYEKREGRKVAIYIDEQNKEHIVYPTCPHMYCSLIFNEVEKTWDCPCHGSRFNIDGRVIEGPSQYDISYKGRS